jgi:hypothetical protein
MVLPLGGLNKTNMGFGKAIQSKFIEEAVGPLLSVPLSRLTTAVLSLTQNTAQASSYPRVQIPEEIPLTMMKVSVPSSYPYQGQ